MPENKQGDFVWPNEAQYYELLHEIGIGASATVWEAVCKANGDHVAVKIVNLDETNTSLDEVRKEIKVISRCSHPNIITYYTSFIKENELWLVMELLEGGSVYDIMRTNFPNGLQDEDLIAAILKQVLQGMCYFHECLHIHRDIKASNLLLDKHGNVRIADFGVSAIINGGFMDRRGVRQTFVGTPCWMAPEVMEQVTGYDYKADIWSFGITALELANGHAPFAKYPPMKVLLMTLQNEPPTLETTLAGGKKSRFSSKFKEVISTCLKKEPKERITSAKLLEKSFFKGVKKSDYVAKHLFNKLPSLQERTRRVKEQLEAEKAASDPRIPASMGWDFPDEEEEVTGLAEGTETPAAAPPVVDAWHSDVGAHYTKGQEAGAGSYKIVYHGVDNRNTGLAIMLHEVPIKAQSTEDEDVEKRAQLHEFLDRVTKLRHPHIISVLDIWETAEALWYATELCETGSLQTYVETNGPTHIDTARRWALQLAHALQYLHAHSIIHRNVNTAEVLLRTKQDKVLDVALCEEILWNIRDDPRFALRPKQRDSYLSPEQYDDTAEKYTEKTDVYSLGMVVLELLSGGPPYSECKNTIMICRRVSQGKTPQALDAVEDSLAQLFIRSCINQQPGNRPTIEAILQDPFIAGAVP
uniref:Protein kinase domain-containing protein n=1 Tax=Eutreptiella gymnastica TaxID=73025 RepID=A0A7S1J7P2_9EUGL|mmetsp:Transcript_73503/g.129545  ORF Transcript_73503/g.129545 Transcript_73503/m.129545 type:complete len:641 (+) Transcript_73503:72-1994(+)